MSVASHSESKEAEVGMSWAIWSLSLSLGVMAPGLGIDVDTNLVACMLFWAVSRAKQVAKRALCCGGGVNTGSLCEMIKVTQDASRLDPCETASL